MKIPGLFPVILILLSIGGCKNDHEGSLTLHFKALYDGLPLPMFTTKPFTSTDQLQFTHLSYLVSDLVLLDHASTVGLKDIEMVDLSFDDVNSADGGYTMHFDNLPAKSYTGIKFGIGVPQDQNAKSPSDFPSSHPLSKTGNYWEAWNSFIFMKTEGRIDTVGNGSFDTGFAYHTGTDHLYRVYTGTLTISIEDGKDKEIDIVIEYKEVFEGIDIKSKPQNHNPQDTVQIGMLVQNLGSALELVQ